jgi:phosphonate ABC transporter permease subunit PhnE
MENNTPPSSRLAVRTLLIVLGVAVGVIVYAYAWNTTEISLDPIQDPTRQSSVTRALSELFRPNIFDRDAKREVLQVPFQIGCPAGETAEQPAHSGDGPYVIFTPPCANVDEIITVEGFNFPPDGLAGLRLVRAEGQNLPFKLASVSGGQTTVSEETTFDVDPSGYFKVMLKVPRGRGLSGTTQTIEIPTISPTGWPRLSKTSHQVIDRMIETIFLALMATTLAVPVSVALSFLAARNLMKQVYLPLGTVLVGFVLLPVGGAMAHYLVSPVGKLGLDWGKGSMLGIVAPVAVTASFAVVSSAASRLRLSGLPERVRAFAMSALLLVVLIFAAGALGGISIWIGDQIDGGVGFVKHVGALTIPLGLFNLKIGQLIDSGAKNLGQFIGTLGQLADLTIGALAAVAGASLLGSVGASVSAGLLRGVRGTLSHVLGAILGFLSGAILLAATAYVGMQAVLLSLLTPVVAAVLGGRILFLLYQHAFGVDKLRRDETAADRLIRMALSIIGSLIAFLVTAYVLNMVGAIVDERLPSIRTWDVGPFSVRMYIAKAAIIGAVLGALGGGLSGTHVSFPLGLAIYNTSRTILNTLRSIEPLIMGIVFVIWVGVGPFAGVLALTLHSIASLGKLYSEQVESIDPGPIEAIQATGANRLQTIVYGVVPQIVPPYIAFTMYRWDINVRMSTIIGFVGGGGIGFLLQQQINLLQYKEAGVAVLAIAIVVSVLDYTSAWLREKII